MGHTIRTDLMEAAYRGSESIVLLLLEHGAEANEADFW
jgi:hypothetical protein